MKQKIEDKIDDLIDKSLAEDETEVKNLLEDAKKDVNNGNRAEAFRKLKTARSKSNYLG